MNTKTLSALTLATLLGVGSTALASDSDSTPVMLRDLIGSDHDDPKLVQFAGQPCKLRSRTFRFARCIIAKDMSEAIDGKRAVLQVSFDTRPSKKLNPSRIIAAGISFEGLEDFDAIVAQLGAVLAEFEAYLGRPHDTYEQGIHMWKVNDLTAFVYVDEDKNVVAGWHAMGK